MRFGMFNLLAPVMALLLLIGIFPNLLLNRINPTTAQIVRSQQQAAPAPAITAEAQP